MPGEMLSVHEMSDWRPDGEGLELVNIPTADKTGADSKPCSEKDGVSTTANAREQKKTDLTTVPQVSEFFCELLGLYATHLVG